MVQGRLELPRPVQGAGLKWVTEYRHYWHRWTLGVLYTAVGILYTTVGILYITVGILYTTVGILYTTVGILYTTVGIRYTTVGILYTTVGKLYTTVGILYTTVGILYTIVGILYTTVEILYTWLLDNWYLTVGIAHTMCWDTSQWCAVCTGMITSPFNKISHVSLSIIAPTYTTAGGRYGWGGDVLDITSSIFIPTHFFQPSPLLLLHYPSPLLYCSAIGIFNLILVHVM